MKTPGSRAAFLLVMLSVAFASTAWPATPPREDAVAPRTSAKRILLTPKDRVLVQCAFVPFEDARRLYACVVGTPAGLHYAYDFETGALHSVWRGAFVDMSEMWEGSGLNQVARPAGDEVPLTTKPLLAFFPDRLFAFPKIWPEQPEPLYASRGYELETNGQPVFLATLESLAIRDRIAPAADGRGLIRRLEFSGRLSPWETWVLLGEDETITPRADGKGWSALNRRWEIEWPATSNYRPVVRATGPRQQLVVRLDQAHLAEPVVYTFLW